MVVLEVHDLSTNFAKDGAKLTREGSGKSVSLFTLEPYLSPANVKT